jgi:hypothetical protein
VNKTLEDGVLNLAKVDLIFKRNSQYKTPKRYKTLKQILSMEKNLPEYDPNIATCTNSIQMANSSLIPTKIGQLKLPLP